jgi:hypothetical protein
VLLSGDVGHASTLHAWTRHQVNAFTATLSMDALLIV